MNNIRRLFAIAILLIFTLCGCNFFNDTTNETPEVINSPVASKAPQETPNVSFLLTNDGYLRYVSIKTGETGVLELDRILTIEWEKIEGQNENNLKELRQYRLDVSMSARIYIDANDRVYRKEIITPIPSEYHLDFADDAYKAIGDQVKRKKLAYSDVARILGGDGFLEKELINAEGAMVSTYKWRNEKGQNILIEFYNGFYNGIIEQ